jgi:hypothetical protein
MRPLVASVRGRRAGGGHTGILERSGARNGRTGQGKIFVDGCLPSPQVRHEREAQGDGNGKGAWRREEPNAGATTRGGRHTPSNPNTPR